MKYVKREPASAERKSHHQLWWDRWWLQKGWLFLFVTWTTLEVLLLLFPAWTLNCAEISRCLTLWISSAPLFWPLSQYAALRSDDWVWKFVPLLLMISWVHNISITCAGINTFLINRLFFYQEPDRFFGPVESIPSSSFIVQIRNVLTFEPLSFSWWNLYVYLLQAHKKQVFHHPHQQPF